MNPRIHIRFGQATECGRSLAGTLVVYDPAYATCLVCAACYARRQDALDAVLAPLMARLGRRGGQSTSPAKQAASRRNGLLGGRRKDRTL